MRKNIHTTVFILLSLLTDFSEADELAPSAEKIKEFISDSCKSCHAGAKGRDVKKFGDFFKFGVLERYVDK